MTSPLERDYGQAVRWGCIPAASTVSLFPAMVEDCHQTYEQVRQLEVKIDEAAEKLMRKVGGLAIQALLNGDNGVPLAHKSEFDFIDDLLNEAKRVGTGGIAGSDYSLSTRHASMLSDMKEVARRLRPLALCCKDRGNNLLLDALGIPYRGKRMVGGV